MEELVNPVKITGWTTFGLKHAEVEIYKKGFLGKEDNMCKNWGMKMCGLLWRTYFNIAEASNCKVAMRTETCQRDRMTCMLAK